MSIQMNKEEELLYALFQAQIRARQNKDPRSLLGVRDFGLNQNLFDGRINSETQEALNKVILGNSELLPIDMSEPDWSIPGPGIQFIWHWAEDLKMVSFDTEHNRLDFKTKDFLFRLGDGYVMELTYAGWPRLTLTYYAESWTEHNRWGTIRGGGGSTKHIDWDMRKSLADFKSYNSPGNLPEKVSEMVKVISEAYQDLQNFCAIGAGIWKTQPDFICVGAYMPVVNWYNEQTLAMQKEYLDLYQFLLTKYPQLNSVVKSSSGGSYGFWVHD